MSSGENVNPIGRLNDGRCDPKHGRFLCGGCAVSSGKLKVYKCEASSGENGNNLSHKPVIYEISITNSICWSPDGATVYLADSPTKQIHSYDYNSQDGSLKNKKLFHETTTGVPDGSCVDSEGFVWNAVWRNGEGPGMVNRIDPSSGEVVFTVHVPDTTSQTSCCCFGGKNLDILFITSAWENLDPSTEIHAGGIYAVKLKGFKGRKEGRFAL